MPLLKFVIFLTAVSGITGKRDPGIQLLVFGGSRLPIEEAPFMAVYFMPAYKKICGASILSKRFVLSAAHCYEKNTRSYVYVGVDSLYNNARKYNIENSIVHPMYKHGEHDYDYDILVIKLSRNLVFSHRVKPIKMAHSKLVLKDGATLTVFGFGLTEYGPSSFLRKVNVPYIAQEKCKTAYEDLTDNMMCAGQEGKDSCQGDSGGPLVYGNVLVGVVSFGRKCGDGDNPGVYASVARLRKFIDYVMNTL